MGSRDELDEDSYNLRPFHINLTNNVPRMRDLIQNTHLPKQEQYPGLGDGISIDSTGISLGTLRGLREEWLSTFDWEKEQDFLNTFDHFTAEIEGQTTHFIHEKSSDPNAIPLLLEHGWPGSFLEFIPLIRHLTARTTTTAGSSVSFNVVIPSLPGFAFSSPPPQNWTTTDTARLHNTLMTEVLGYSEYAVHGTDLGAWPAYILYRDYPTATRALHLNLLPFYPPTLEEMTRNGIELSELEQFEQNRTVAWEASGTGYYVVHSTKPNTIGLALQDHPMGQLAWMGEKWIQWSDPRAGTPPSVLTSNEILRSVSLYYLTGSFTSSIYQYFLNSNDGFFSPYSKPNTDAPMLFSTFKYNTAFWPEAVVARVGNLVFYKNHEFGGHFPGLDNPRALMEDLREIGTYWAKDAVEK